MEEEERAAVLGAGRGAEDRDGRRGVAGPGCCGAGRGTTIILETCARATGTGTIRRTGTTTSGSGAFGPPGNAGSVAEILGVQGCRGMLPKSITALHSWPVHPRVDGPKMLRVLRSVVGAIQGRPEAHIVEMPDAQKRLPVGTAGVIRESVPVCLPGVPRQAEQGALRRLLHESGAKSLVFAARVEGEQLPTGRVPVVLDTRPQAQIDFSSTSDRPHRPPCAGERHRTRVREAVHPPFLCVSPKKGYARVSGAVCPLNLFGSSIPSTAGD